MRRILHLAKRSDWETARLDGTYRWSTRDATVADTGFVHASTSAQLPRVAAMAYADLPSSELVVLVVDLDTLTSQGIDVRWENLDGGTEPFPHVYAPLPTSAVVAVLDVGGDGSGGHAMPDVTGFGVV